MTEGKHDGACVELSTLRAHRLIGIPAVSLKEV